MRIALSIKRLAAGFVTVLMFLNLLKRGDVQEVALFGFGGASHMDMTPNQAMSDIHFFDMEHSVYRKWAEEYEHFHMNPKHLE